MDALITLVLVAVVFGVVVLVVVGVTIWLLRKADFDASQIRPLKAGELERARSRVKRSLPWWAIFFPTFWGKP